MFTPWKGTILGGSVLEAVTQTHGFGTVPESGVKCVATLGKFLGAHRAKHRSVYGEMWGELWVFLIKMIYFSCVLSVFRYFGDIFINQKSLYEYGFSVYMELSI